jgi:hypothetical protein
VPTGRLAVAVTAAALLVAAGCARKAGLPATTPRLVEVRVVDRGAEPGAERQLAGAVDVAALGARVRERLRAAALLELAEGREARPDLDWSLRVDVLVERQPAGDGTPGSLRAFVGTRLVRAGAPGEPPIESRVVAERVLGVPGSTEEPTSAGARAHLERALDDALRGLVAKARARLGGEREIEAALHDADPEVQVEAIRAAALRRSEAAVPTLIALLGDEDAATRDHALGALVEIGDRRAVKPITRLARFQDIAELPKVIDAVGALGGDEARAFLEFVVSAHEDPEMRALAREALGRLQRRAAAPPPTGP